tara:strand:+ start:32 stop:508 length:477 start_codon:yes stop_codon:yes gene_type:complete
MVEVFEYKNFISKDLCDYFIKYHKNNFSKIPNCSYNGPFKVIDIYPICGINENFKSLLSKLLILNNKNQTHFIDYFEIVGWDPGSAMIPHKDFKHQSWSAVLYLNEDYEGGQTYFEDKIIKPETGKMLFFTGSKLKHGVKKLEKGQRYVITAWYCPLK